MSHAADGTPRRRYLAAACLVLAAAGVLVGDKLLGPLFYLLIGAASTVLLLGARRRHPPEIRLLARLAGIGALGLSLAGLTSVCIVPELAQGIVLKTGRSLQPVPVQAARVSVLLVVFSAFTSRLSGARWQTGRPAQVAAILAAVLVWLGAAPCGECRRLDHAAGKQGQQMTTKRVTHSPDEQAAARLGRKGRPA